MPATKNNSHPTLSYVTQLYDMKKNKRFKIRAVFFCKKSKKGIFLSHLHYYWRHFAFSIKKPGMCLTTHTCFPIKHLLLIKKRKNFTYIIRSVNSVVYIKFTD